MATSRDRSLLRLGLKATSRTNQFSRWRLKGTLVRLRLRPPRSLSGAWSDISSRNSQSGRSGSLTETMLKYGRKCSFQGSE
jgi:hypothetical protein